MPRARQRQGERSTFGQCHSGSGMRQGESTYDVRRSNPCRAVFPAVPIRFGYPLGVARPCLVCEMDPWQRDQIESLLQEGKSLRLTAAISGLSKSALFRHRRNHPRRGRAGLPKPSVPVIYNPRALWEREVALRRAERDAAVRRLERDFGKEGAAYLLGGDLRESTDE
jgi:hypothetical protein